jgi:cbb3-type cytochrome oxidase subunit 3
MFDPLSKISALWLFVAIVGVSFIAITITAYQNKKRREAQRAEESTFGWQLQQQVNRLRKEAEDKVKPQNRHQYDEVEKKLKAQQTAEVKALKNAYNLTFEGDYPTAGPWAIKMKDLLKKHTEQKPEGWYTKPDYSPADKAKAEGFATYTAKGPRLWKGTLCRSHYQDVDVIVLALSYDEAKSLIAAEHGSNSEHVRWVWPAE